MELILAWSHVIMRDNFIEQRRYAYGIVIKEILISKSKEWKLKFKKDFQITDDQYEDYLQELFLKIWENRIINAESKPLPIIRDENGIFNFFYKAIRNYVIDKCRLLNARGCIYTMTEDEIQSVCKGSNYNIEDQLDVEEVQATINNPIYAETIQMIRNIKGYGIGDKMSQFYQLRPDCALLLARFYELDSPPGIYEQLIGFYSDYSQSTIPALTTKKNECLIKIRNYLQLNN